jgi:hypothetical protein
MCSFVKFLKNAVKAGIKAKMLAGQVALEEPIMKIRLYMLTDKGDIFLTEYHNVDGIAEAFRDIFHALWMHGALAEVKGFKVEWGDD